MVRRVLVTGGAGFIGSHVVDDLVTAGREVRVLDSLTPGAPDSSPDYLNAGAEYVFGDVRDSELVERCLEGVDAVAHLAAKVGLGVDLGDIEEYVSHNGFGTAALLGAMHARSFAGRLVLGSSMVVYGEGRYRCDEHGLVAPGPRNPNDLAEGKFEPRCPGCGAALSTEAVPEDASLDPRNVYAATKLHQEHLCAAWSRETGCPVTALRFHNVYGPRMRANTPYAGVASVFRSALAAGIPPRVFEDGKQLRDFVHVRDVARATARALLAGPAVPGAFNVASGSPHTVGEMAEALAAAVGGGSPRPVVTEEFRLGDVRHVFASPDRAREQLGFRAAVSFGEGIREFALARLRTDRPVPAGISESENSPQGFRNDGAIGWRGGGETQ
ncbi:MAG: NAD-dependent epimerase/dehydratase family protein [Actinomycetota bacterium]